MPSKKLLFRLHATVPDHTDPGVVETALNAALDEDDGFTGAAWMIGSVTYDSADARTFGEVLTRYARLLRLHGLGES